ncbi:4Fe-4S dicluster domain-containing protein [Butyrivibrio sp. Su6]|nr:4Fe-4S dicluster domain-containing protein [Butyrivibrio sp. Su6]
MIKMERIPDLYNKKEECCGCSACFSICPKMAISMMPDDEGFLYPLIDEAKCIQCYLCIKVCPLK